MYTCKHCDKTFEDYEVLKKHGARMHGVTFHQLYVDTFLDGQYPLCACGCLEPVEWNAVKKEFRKYKNHHRNITGANNPNWDATIERPTELPWACSRCDAKFEEYDSLKRHAGRVHKIHSSQSYIEYQLGGIAPTCKCGCGELVGWRKNKFYDYARDHIDRNGANNPYYGKKHSDEVRQVMQEKSVDAVVKRQELNRQRMYLQYTTEYQGKFELLFSETDYIGTKVPGEHYKVQKYPLKCLGCQLVFDGSFENGLSLRCPTCNPYIASSGEIELVAYIKSIYTGPLKEKNREVIRPKELDVYLPDLKLAIEYDGIYWHSELAGKESDYHLQKTNECAAKGVQLLHIFETEWLHKQDIVKAILQRAIGHTSTKLFARKTDVQVVPDDIAHTFFDTYHLQGRDKASIYLGLYFEGSLVSIMSFTSPRFTDKYEWEISRLATMHGITVVGGAAKLFQAFITQHRPKSVITYSDRRYFSGGTYQGMGFVEQEVTPPAYHYFLNGTTYLQNRLQFQKHKLHEKLEHFDENLTEWENMQLNDYNRIWDCGHRKFIWLAQLEG